MRILQHPTNLPGDGYIYPDSMEIQKLVMNCPNCAMPMAPVIIQNGSTISDLTCANCGFVGHMKDGVFNTASEANVGQTEIAVVGVEEVAGDLSKQVAEAEQLELEQVAQAEPPVEEPPIEEPPIELAPETPAAKETKTETQL